MKTSTIFAYLGLFVLATVQNVFAHSPRLSKPNVLVLLSDDQRADTVEAYGNSQIRTPNLNQLVREGFSLRNHYILGGNSGAVCVPSRAMLMTGKAWFRFDTGTIRGQKMLPELLRENGYKTFATGKWHNGEESFVRGFQVGNCIMFGGMSDHTKVPLRDLMADGTLTKSVTGDGFSSELFADSAIEFIESVRPDEPFMAYVAFTAPHDPRQPPVAFRDYYYANLPTLPPNFLPQLPFDNGMMNGGRDENLAGWPRTETVIRDQLAEYYGMITHLDEQIGRILETLKKRDLDKNTIVVFAADNGLALGSHGLLGKQNVFEHSMRVPCILRGPNIPEGVETKSFTYMLDILPTLCELLNIEVPSKLDGVSLLPVIQDPKRSVRDSIFLPFLDIQRSIRHGDWKMICYPKIGYRQLFNLQLDPNETKNLADLESSQQVLERLERIMLREQESFADTLRIPATLKPLEEIDLTNKRRVPDEWQPEWIVKKYFGDPFK